jgi:hypothetical protein
VPTTALTLNSTTQAATFAGAVTIPSLNATNTFGFKNRIINGGMSIDQRNAGASITATTTATPTYCLDRWAYQCSQASKFTVQQNAGSVTPPAGFGNYLGVTSSSAYTVGSSDYFLIRQPLEGYNTSDLGFGTANAKTITISFWVRSSLTGTFGGSLENSASDRSYPFSYTISAANTWEQKSVTIAGDTTGTWAGATNTGSLLVIFGLGVGSTFSNTASSWYAGNYLSTTGATSVVGTSGATFYITGVQLEVGSQATSFDFRSYSTELGLSYRYYYKQVPGQPYTRFAAGYSSSSGAGTFTTQFPVTMRVAPTSLDVAGSLGAWSGGTIYTVFTIALDSSGNTPNFGCTGITTSGLTALASYTLIGNNSTTSFMAYNAEL